jgi:hypothetical protein
MVVKVVREAVQAAPEVVERVKLDATLLAEARKAAKAKKAAAPVSHAAE